MHSPIAAPTAGLRILSATDLLVTDLELDQRFADPQLTIEPIAMTENPYARWLRTDFDVCLPVIGTDGLTTIREQVAIRVYQMMGTGPDPSLYLDLEQLQVVDYSAFEGVSEEQRAFIIGLHTREPIRPEEMIFFALRSLFQFGWPKPTSNDHIRFAAAYDHALNQILADSALDLTKQFTAPEALLPYWGRLAFLKVMVGLPTDHISLDSVLIVWSARWLRKQSSMRPRSHSRTVR